ncbi:hypothetical protein HQ489_06045 [Candidatus Woesearchaeota archaeon]|nr:hypothetical protein [Candidatus Woesearchaeota archaeon]
MEQRKIGVIIIVASIIVLGLLIFLKVETDNQMLNACEKSCGDLGGNNCSLDSCPYHQGNGLSWVLIVMSIFIAFLGGTGIYLFLPKKHENIIEKKEYDLTVLADEEKKIFYYIKNHKEGVYQSHVVKKFDLSKVQATRLLDKFEGMDLIQRKRKGLANLVSVK